MQSRSISREIALLVLGQIADNSLDSLKGVSIDNLLGLALETLMNHWREQLDECANHIQFAQEELLDSELKEFDKNNIPNIRINLKNVLNQSESVINNLSDCLELVKLLSLSDQKNIRMEALQRIKLVLENIQTIDSTLNNVMEGWRLKRLPRIDQDILRLAYIDTFTLKTPIPVACNEAVNLANRYSDDQGRRMINGILRRLQTSPKTNKI